MKKNWLIGAGILLMLSGCGAEETAEAEHEGTLEPIEVEILTAAAAEPGTEMMLEAEVTQGGEPVEDAQEVMFEVWESGDRENAEKIEGAHTADGVYSAEKVFGEEGLYYIIAHTTARGLHTMPQSEITIGNPDPASIVPDESEPSDGMENHESHN